MCICVCVASVHVYLCVVCACARVHVPVWCCASFPEGAGYTDSSPQLGQQALLSLSPCSTPFYFCLFCFWLRIYSKRLKLFEKSIC